MTSAAGYAAEMRRIEEDIAKVNGALCSAPIDAERITRHIYRLYQKASISGDLGGLNAVERSINDAIPVLSNPGDLYLLKAHAAFKLHHLAAVDFALRAVPSVYDSDEGRLIRADLDFQHGHYSAAESGYVDVLGHERSWGAWLGRDISAVRWAISPTRTVFSRLRPQCLHLVRRFVRREQE
jgi:hypothetical protein